jgi:hypothetical protein
LFSPRFVPNLACKNEGVKVVSGKNGKKKASTKFPAKVEKVIKPVPGSGEPEKAQIAVEGADHLYRELRVPNKLVDGDGNKVTLKQGTEVEVKIESEEEDTIETTSSSAD